MDDLQIVTILSTCSFMYIPWSANRSAHVVAPFYGPGIGVELWIEDVPPHSDVELEVSAA